MDLDTHLAPEQIFPARKLKGSVAGTFVAPSGTFETHAVDALSLGFDGIADDFHAGRTRRSGGREPWYPRGTEIRNERQLTLVAPDELARIAAAMDTAVVLPQWIGANLLVEGIPHLSMLPAGTLMFFENGVTLKIDAQNAPCRQAGRLLAERAGFADTAAAALLFPKVARRLRGLTAWVEKPGTISRGEAITARVPEQWLYRG